MNSSSFSLRSRAVALLLAISAVSGFACSRNKSARRTPSAASDSANAFGPRVDLLPSAEASAVPTPTSAAPAASALPVVDGATLLEKIRASGHKGVVINAWASWCDPCREELPMLARVAPKLAAKGVPIWLVSVDDPDGFSAAKAVLESLHIELPSYAAAPPLQAFKIAMNPNWPGMIPVSFLFDATGKLRYFWAGEVYEKELVPIVEGFAAGKHIDGVSDYGLAPGATQGAH
ncbi:MAG: TlpA disulfide reductase family protein [Pseudomonadota bacterium]